MLLELATFISLVQKLNQAPKDVSPEEEKIPELRHTSDAHTAPGYFDDEDDAADDVDVDVVDAGDDAGDDVIACHRKGRQE